MKKQLCGLFLILVMALSLVPTQIFAGSAAAHTGASAEAVLTGVPSLSSVTDITYASLKGRSKLAGVPVPTSVKRIKQDAAEDCSGLTGVPSLSSVTDITYASLKGRSKLAGVPIPTSVKSIKATK